MPSMTSEEYQIALDDAHRRRAYWEKNSGLHREAEEYYRTELAKAHALVGRLLQQMGERWDSARLTEYFPTDNLHTQRSMTNPSGDSKRKDFLP